MSRLTKFGLVFLGYILACLAASGVASMYQRLTQDPAAQSSAGMYAFGDLLLFIGVFGLLMIVPTGLAIYYLLRRRKRR
jgi:hypothetical protein